MKGIYIVDIDIKNKRSEEISKMEYSLQTITYKGNTHLYNYGFYTDCGIEIPLQGRHLQTRKHIQDLSSITCKACLKTLEQEQE